MKFVVAAALCVAWLGAVAFGATASDTMPDVIVFRKNSVRPNFVTSDEFPCVILYETEKAVVINRSATVGIKDEVEIPRFMIEEVRRGQPGAREYEEAMAHGKLPENSEKPEYYQGVIAKYFDPFLEKFSTHPKADDIRRIREEFEAESKRVSQGEAREGQKWTVTVADLKEEARQNNPQTWREKLEQEVAEERFAAFYDTVKDLPSSLPNEDFPSLVKRAVALIDDVRRQIRDPAKSPEIAALSARLQATTQPLVEAINVHAEPVEGDHTGDASFTKNEKDQKFYRNDSIGNYPQFAAFYLNDGFPKKALTPDQIAQLETKLPEIVKLKEELDIVTARTMDLPRLLEEQKRRILEFNLAPYSKMAQRKYEEKLTHQIEVFEEAFSRGNLMAATDAFLEARQIDPTSEEVTDIQGKLQAAYLAAVGVVLLVLVMTTKFVRKVYDRRK